MNRLYKNIEAAYKNPNCHSAAGEESPAFMNLSPDVLVIIMGFKKEIIWTYVLRLAKKLKQFINCSYKSIGI